MFFNIFLTINDAAGLAYMGKRYSDLILDFILDLGGCSGDSAEMAELVEHLFLFGPAYKGIPLAAIAAEWLYREQGLNFRWGYDRKEAKTHGEKGGAESPESLLDGDVHDGDRVIIIDDILTEGTAKQEVIDKISAYASAKGIEVSIAGIATFVDRWEGGQELRAQYPVCAVLRMDHVAKEAFDQALISQEDYDRYVDYFQQYRLD
ncbi:MAG TPA: phosphoribosyltransferase family protein [Candidatus Lokiarchaeia archaeon]|nr:phosphoribosyltransferase family protein [Candidatus Lokiarchaeia archaeon]